MVVNELLGACVWLSLADIPSSFLYLYPTLLLMQDAVPARDELSWRELVEILLLLLPLLLLRP